MSGKVFDNPDSYFLRFPDKPQNRIIALPSHIGGEASISGIKWISSYPDNIKQGIQRASATLILNDGETGFPLACLESGLISAVRTAVSAAAALHYLKGGERKVNTLGIVGTGYIAKNMIDSLFELDWTFEQINLFDMNPEYAASLKQYIEARFDGRVNQLDSLDNLITGSEVIVTTTTAAEPYIQNMALFAHNPIVLNISLRDFSEDIILNSNNVLDDVQHCLKANTSPHLAYQKAGNLDFINGHFGDLQSGGLELDASKPTVFSPFGLGVLDLALGQFVYEKARSSDTCVEVDNFFGEQTRW